VIEYYLSVCLKLVSMLVAALLGLPATVTEERAMSLEPAAVSFHEVRLPNGLEVHYARQGPETGPAVIMLHGYTDSWFSFSRVLPLLPGNMRVIVPDQRGHGTTGRPESGYAVDDLATDVVQLMDALKVPEAVVVGHSMGSFVARRVAERAPARVTRLVLMGSAPTLRNAAVTELQAAVNGLTDPVDPDFVRGFQEGTVNQPVPAEFMARVIATSQAMPARVWKALADGMMAFSPGTPPRCPTLVLGGDRDGVFSREEQAALAAGIPGATLDLVEGVGHALHWEDPERFVAALSDFAGFAKGR
jgi:non-heme chloroperoxidase